MAPRVRSPAGTASNGWISAYRRHASARCPSGSRWKSAIVALPADVSGADPSPHARARERERARAPGGLEVGTGNDGLASPCLVFHQQPTLTHELTQYIHAPVH